MDVGKLELQEMQVSDMFLQAVRQLRQSNNQSPSGSSKKDGNGNGKNSGKNGRKSTSISSASNSKVNQKSPFCQSPLPPIPVVSAVCPVPPPAPINIDASLSQPPVTSSLYSSLYNSEDQPAMYHYNPPNFLSLSHSTCNSKSNGHLNSKPNSNKISSSSSSKPFGLSHYSNSNSNSNSMTPEKGKSINGKCKSKKSSELIISMDQWKSHDPLSHPLQQLQQQQHHNQQNQLHPSAQNCYPENYEANYLRYHKTFSQPSKSNSKSVSRAKNKIPFALVNDSCSSASFLRSRTPPPLPYHQQQQQQYPNFFPSQNQSQSQTQYQYQCQYQGSTITSTPTKHQQENGGHFLSFKKIPTQRQRSATLNHCSGRNGDRNRTNGRTTREFPLTKSYQNSHDNDIDNDIDHSNENYVDVDEVDMCLKSGNSLDSDEDEDEDDDDCDEALNISGEPEPFYESVSPAPFQNGCPYAIPMMNLGSKNQRERERERQKDKSKKSKKSRKSRNCPNQSFSSATTTTTTTSGIASCGSGSGSGSASASSAHEKTNSDLCNGDDRESLSLSLGYCSGPGIGNGSGSGTAGTCVGAGAGIGSSVSLRAQLRDQLMQDQINISRISDEGILRTMALQYSAELASTLTLTPSSNSCSSSSNSSCGSGISTGISTGSGSGSASGSGSGSSHHQAQTPADLHYEKVFNQLRELWLEERMKMSNPTCPMNCGQINPNTPMPMNMSMTVSDDDGGFSYLDTTVVSGPANGHGYVNGMLNGGFSRGHNNNSHNNMNIKSSSCSSTPAVTTPCETGLSLAQCLALQNQNPHTNPNSNLHHLNGKNQTQNQHQCLSNAVSVPCLLPGCNSSHTHTNQYISNSNLNLNSQSFHQNNNNNNNVNNINNNNNNSVSQNSFMCKSPERTHNQNQNHPHQYLQHVIVSNGEQQLQSSNSNSDQNQNNSCCRINSVGFNPNSNSNLNGVTGNSNSTPSKTKAGQNNNVNCNSNSNGNNLANGLQQSVKQAYKPGIYLPSSCLRDKDEIYDYAPPIRLDLEDDSPVHEPINPSQNHYSPSNRCFVQPKGYSTSSRNPKEPNSNSNFISTIRGSSKSSYALSSASYSHHNSPGSNSGVKSGCTTLSNLSKLSRRLGLSRFFRTLRIHGGNPNSNPNANSSSNFIANPNSISNCNQNSNGNGTLRNLYDNQSNAECERIHFSQNYNQSLYKNSCSNGIGLQQDVTKTPKSSKCPNGASISSLPSNERIIETINRLKHQELEKRKERLVQEQMEDQMSPQLDLPCPIQLTDDDCDYDCKS